MAPGRGIGSIAVGWATVDLDRTIEALAAELGVSTAGVRRGR